MLEIGQEWLLYATPFRLKEVAAAPSGGEIIPNVVSLYAKDKAGVSHLYWQDDGGTEHDLEGNLFGSGTTNRLAYWSSSNTLAANAALTATRVLFADANGLPTDDSDMTFATDTLTVTKLRSTNVGIGGAPGSLPLEVYASANDTLTGIMIRSQASPTTRYGISTHQGGVFYFTSVDQAALDAEQSFIFRQHSLGSGTGREIARFGPLGGLHVGSSGSSIALGVIDAATGYRVANAATSGNVLRGNGTNFVSAQLAHSDLSGLTTGDPHTQYALLAGRSGGQILKGGTGSGDDLQLISTDHATKGSIIFGTGSTYDEANDRLGIGLTTTPFQKVHIRGTEIDVGILSDYFGDGPNAGFFAVRNNRGTVASPTATQNNDILGTILWQGRYGTTAGDADIQNGVVLRGIATENWTGSAIGAQLSMFLTVKGSTAQVEMLKFKIADDVSQIVWNNHGASKQMNFTWQDNGTDKWILYKTTDNIFNIYYSPTGSSLIRCNPVDGNPSVSAVLLGLGTITTTQTNYSAVSVQPLLNGSGDGPQGFNIGPAIRPSANVNNAYGYLALPAFGPASGATITNAFGFYSRFDTANTGGAIGNGYTGFFAAPTFDTLKPTSMFGAYIQNQGSASITNVVGLRLDAQSGGTNNWVMELPADATDPTSGGGAATGRIACVIGGVTRYIPYY